MHRPAPGLDHRLPIGLLVVGDPDHEHLALEPEELARASADPHCPRAGLGRELPDPRLAVVEGLCDRRVRLMGPRGRDALILVVDVRGRIEPARGASPAAALAARGGRRRGPPPGSRCRDRSGSCAIMPSGRSPKVFRPDRLAGRRAERGGAAGPLAGRPVGSPSWSGSPPRKWELDRLFHGSSILCRAGARPSHGPCSQEPRAATYPRSLRASSCACRASGSRSPKRARCSSTWGSCA